MHINSYLYLYIKTTHHLYPKIYDYIQNWGLIKSFDSSPILFFISSLLPKYNYCFCYHTCLYTSIETIDIWNYKMHILTKFNDDDRNYVDLPLWLPVALSLLEYWESAHSYLALACHVSLAQLAILEPFPIFSIFFP